MNYTVFDLEQNQGPNGEEDSVDHLPSETIEISAIKSDEGFCQVGEFHKLVRPQVYKKLHFKVSEVTHMDMRKPCQEGQRFEGVIREFVEWRGEEEYCFCTWGSMDLVELQRSTAYYGLDIPFPRPLLYYNIQKLLCFQYGDGKNEVSLDQAVQQVAMEEGRLFRRVLDDAYYTGRVLSALDMDLHGVHVSIDYHGLPDEKDKESYLYFPKYTKFVSRESDSREKIMKDKNITDMMYLKCRRMLCKKICWFPYGQRFYFCLTYCPEHGYVKGKIRVKKSEKDRHYIAKTTRMARGGDVELLAQREEDGRRKRSAKSHTREYDNN